MSARKTTAPPATPARSNKPAQKVRIWKGYVVRGWNAYGKALAATEFTQEREAQNERGAMERSGLYARVTVHFEHVAGGRTMLQREVPR